MLRIPTTLLATIAIGITCSVPAAAEFTADEKAQVQKMATTLDNARWLVYYAGNALRRSTAASKDAHANFLTQSISLYNELRIAMNSILGLRSFAGQKQEQLNKDALYRVTLAKRYLSRGLGGYRDKAVASALAAVAQAGDTHAEIATYAPRTLAAARATYAEIDLDCCKFDNWKLSDWPFLVRRTSDGLGVHGDFETAKEHEARGRAYITSAVFQTAEVVRKMPWTPEIYGGVRNLTLGFKDTMARLLDIHLVAYGIGKGDGLDPFARLLVANEDGLDRAGAGLRGMMMFSLRPVVRYMAEHGDRGTGAAEHLAEAVEKAGDGWFFAVDSWTWETIRFACLEGFESVGCAMP